MNAIANLPREAYVRMADLASRKDRIGITGLGATTLYKLIKQGKFPQPRNIEGVKGSFFIYGEVLDWLNGKAGEP